MSWNNWKEYENGDKVRALEAELKEISPELKIGGMGGADHVIRYVETMLTEKGNRPILRALEQHGYQKSYRQLTEGSYRVTMRKYVEGEK